MAAAPDPDELLRSTTGKGHFQRVTRLLISGGTVLLREIFDLICPPRDLPRILNNPATKNQLKAAKLTKPQRDCLYPTPGVYGQSTDFDITLLFSLLRTICGFIPPPLSWDALPASTDHTLTADLARIKYYRNSVYAHVNQNMKIKDDEFLRFWQDISEALVRIAGQISPTKKQEWQEAIDNFLKEPLTAEDERNVQELRRWYRNDMEVKESIEELRTTTQEVREGMEHLGTSFKAFREEAKDIKHQLIEVHQSIDKLSTSACGPQAAGVQVRVRIDCQTTSEPGPQIGTSETVVASQGPQAGGQGTAVVPIASVQPQAEAQILLNHIASRYFQSIAPSNHDEFNGFLQYMKDMRKVLIVDVKPGSLIITVECSSLEVLEGLWEDYCTGFLNEMAQQFLVTEDILKELGLTEAKLTTTILEEEYRACREYFVHGPAYSPRYMTSTSSTQFSSELTPGQGPHEVTPKGGPNMELFMASAVPTASSTKETTNYARLCRLLVDIGTQALRDSLDAIHPPANLHAVLAGNIATLQPLRARRIINPIQWGKLFPAIPTSVSSRDFDTTLLMVLLRNLCGLTPPLTGWDAFPALTDLSREADIARIKYFRNTVYGHAETASVDETTFNDYWRDIRDTLVRLGGVTYKAAIDDLRNECMDPEVQDHYRELLSQWKKDDDNMIEKLDEKLDEIMKKLDVLTASKEPTADEGEFSKPKETVRGIVLCKENFHENEPLEYYCQQCKVCICLKCGHTHHDHHKKVDIQQAAEERKVPIEQVLEKAKAEVVVVEGKITKQIELRNKSKARNIAAQNKLSETVEEFIQQVIQAVRDQETTTKNKLIEIDETQERDHVAQLEKFQSILTELNNSIEHGEDMFQRCIPHEILQEEHAVFGGCEELLTHSQKMEVYKSELVNYVVNKGTASAVRRLLPLGQVVVRDHSQSVAEGKGLKKAEMGAETKFTITTRDSEGKQFYDEQDQVTVTVSSSTGDEEVLIRDCKDGMYTVHYKPKSVGRHDVAIEFNGWPLTGSPWSVNVTPHRYRVAMWCGSLGERPGEFNAPVGIAKNERTGNIAVADYGNKRIQLFNKDFKYLSTIGGVTGLPTGAVKIGHPTSIAFSRDGDLIVTHGDTKSRKMSVITARDQFIEHFSEHVIIPFRVFVKTDGDGHVIVCDAGDKQIKVLSPDGAELLQSFSAPHCNEYPEFVCYHHDMFFVSYYRAHCVKVFHKEGVFLYDIGSEGSGDEQLCLPMGLVVDAFDNLIVCDTGNKRLKVFTLEGKFLTLIDEGTGHPGFVTVCNNGDVLVSDGTKHCIHVLQ